MKEIWKDIEGFPGYLVLDAFVGPEPELVVNHINGNKQDNRLENLEWVTAAQNSTLAAKAGLYKTKPVEIIETGEIFNSIRECGKALGVHPSCVTDAVRGNLKTVADLHVRESTKKPLPKKPFLYDHQMRAVNDLSNGKILCGGTGSGKSRTALFYYFKEQNGWIDENGYKPMVNPKDLYIITTAKKRDSGEWLQELVPFLMYGQDETDTLYSHKIVIESWNNLSKYRNVHGAFWVFDEQKVSGTGAWVKAFLDITRKNQWILLSATPADKYEDLRPVFIANGFYKNKTEFNSEHLRYDPYCRNYPRVIGYMNESRLEYYRNLVMVDMDFERHTVPHHEDVYVKYDIDLYRSVSRHRTNPYKTVVWEDGSEHPAPIVNAAELCYTWRRIVNSDESRQVALLEILERHPRAIIFYSYDYELNILRNLGYDKDVVVAEWNGHKHESIPETEKWVYLVQYFGAESWNCIQTNTVIFFSQQYSYKTLEQARGRVDRLNTPYTDLYYYYLKSRSGIDLAISNALVKKKNFNESRWVKW